MKGFLLLVTAPVWVPVLLATSCAVIVLGGLVLLVTGRAPVEVVDGWIARDGDAGD